MTDVQIKITASEAGCWLDGSQGWHNTYRIVDLAESWGWEGPSEEGWKDVVNRYRADVGTDEDHEAMIGQGGLADQAFGYLDGLTVSCHFERDMGELVLLRCQDLETFGNSDACDCEVKS